MTVSPFYFLYWNIVILGSSALIAGNIKNGITIFGVKGTFTGWVDNKGETFNVTAVYHYLGVTGDQDWKNYWSCYLSKQINITGWKYINFKPNGYSKTDKMTWRYRYAFRTSSSGSSWYAFSGKYNHEWYDGDWFEIDEYKYNDGVKLDDCIRVEIKTFELSNYHTVYAVSAQSYQADESLRNLKVQIWFSLT